MADNKIFEDRLDNEPIAEKNFRLNDALIKHSERLSREKLTEKAVEQGAVISSGGHVVNDSGKIKGRAAQFKRVVDNLEDDKDVPQTSWSDVNKPTTQNNFDKLYFDMLEHLDSKEITFTGNRSVIAPNNDVDPYAIRNVTESAFAQMFTENMTLPARGTEEKVTGEITIVHAPSFIPNKKDHGIDDGGIFIDFKTRTVLIAGTHYAGEIKKAIFTILNRELPERGVLPLHSSAGKDKYGNVHMFFGLSGTGKTTLSAMLDELIGDDEIGWGEGGVFNFEGGCYAKVIGLTEEREPEIWDAVMNEDKEGRLLENTHLDEDGNPDFFHEDTDDNARGSYPGGNLESWGKEGTGGHPKNIFFLCYDTDGVIPPLSKLTPEQIKYYFLSGYTSKVAGTEVKSEGDTQDDTSGELDKAEAPKAQRTFSVGFGEPFLPLDAMIYADMLVKMVKEHDVNVWMVNTGNLGDPSEETGVGERIDLKDTKALVQGVIDGKFDEIDTHESVLGLQVPDKVPKGVELTSDILEPRDQWKDEEEFESRAETLQGYFAENWEAKGFGAVA